MSKVFAGSDDSFMSAWQMWKRKNKQYESFVLAQEEREILESNSPRT